MNMEKMLADMMAAQDNMPTWLTTEQVAKMIGLSVSALEKWRRQGKGPAFKRLSRRCVRYDPKVVLAWIESSDRAVIA